MTEIDHNKRHLIVGAGKTGLSVARYLGRESVPFAVADSRPMQSLPMAALDGAGRVFSGDFAACRSVDYEVLVVSPGIPVSTPEIVAARARGAEIIGDIELFARALKARQVAPQVLAVTGSNGKSTVVSMIGEILLAAGANAAVGGNLGTPALDLLCDRPDADIYVLELSSFQLETTDSLRPTGASVLNISADHLDRYPSLAAYARIKRRIYRHSRRCVYNADDPLTVPETWQDAVCFATDGALNPDYYLSAATIMRRQEAVFSVADLRVSGAHNAINATAAVAMVATLPETLAVDQPAIRAGLAAFVGLPHRTQWVASKNEVDWYNDSKGTNVGATIAAISGLARPVVLIAGGDGKGADFTPLAQTHPQCRAAVLMGRDAPRIAAALRGKVQTTIQPDMRAAVGRARQLARAGDAVLLSPACASLDMYGGYQERGEDFVTAVREVLA